MLEGSIPIQPVEDPILCSPYEEPDQHWLYDTKTGRPSKVPSRREASYWFRTERTGSAQRSLLAEEERDDLPLVNALREDVRRWRGAGWQNASETTRKLLRHWWREDRARRLFFCQLEAVETILYLQEILAAGKRTRWRPRLARDEFETLRVGRNPRPLEWVTTIAQHPKLADFPNEAGSRPIPRYACKMATGAGKTVVMSMLIAWAFCNRGANPGDPSYPRRVLVVCPNLTIRERLSVLRPGDLGNYYDQFDIVPSSMRPELAKGKVLVTNWHRFSPEAETISVGGVQVGKLGEETPEAFARARLGDLWDDEPLMVLNDEGHHAYPARTGGRGDEALRRGEGGSRGSHRLGERSRQDQRRLRHRHLRGPLGDPVLHPGKRIPGGSPFPWIESATSAWWTRFEAGITKIPAPAGPRQHRTPPIRSTSAVGARREEPSAGGSAAGRKPKRRRSIVEAEDALLTLASEWKERFEQLRAGEPGRIERRRW